MNLSAATWQWLSTPDSWTGASGIGARLLEHVGLSLLAVLIAAVLAIPVGLYIGHSGRGQQLAVATVGMARAIPTIGVITLCALALGIGLTAPLVALVVLAVPSLLAASYSGVAAVDRGAIAGARAIGFSGPGLLWRVEIPLAAATIIGGIRVALLQVVATATLAAYTADIGLGRFIFSGLKTADYPMMAGASVLLIVVALLLELLGALTQHGVRRAIVSPA